MKRLQQRLRGRPSVISCNDDTNPSKLSFDYSNDALSKNSFPSPQGSMVESSISSSLSGSHINSTFFTKNETHSSSIALQKGRNRREETIEEIDSSLAESSSKMSSSKSSSSYFKSNRDSTYTFSNGSSVENDSFVASATGLSFADSSQISFYSFDPFKNRKRNISSSHDPQQQQQQEQEQNRPYRQHPKDTTNNLPRLTLASSRHTNQYLQQRNNPYPLTKTKKQIPQPEQTTEKSTLSPQSMTTVDTEPITPRDTSSSSNDFDASWEEFPMSPFDTTPKFNFSLDQSSKVVEDNLTFPVDFKPNYSISREDESPSLCEDSSSTRSSSKASYSSSIQLFRDNRKMNAASAEKDYWMKDLQDVIIQYGQDSIETARLLDKVGSALFRCKEYQEALSIYKQMIGILRSHYDEESLVYARALDKVGLAASKCPSQENLECALLASNEALNVRISQLGPHHCDTVDNLNNIAGILLQMRDLRRARHVYEDVLTVRAAIFGRNHPSVAITASSLGDVCSHLSDFDDSIRYYDLALSIYREEPMMLRDSHPLIQNTIKKIERSNRLMACNV